ncbi:MAG: PAS domain-containing protein [Thermoplasmatales archaeon]|nr:MAG: PAS domain-containing protein [Thermoplasmatales archaeon]
MKISYQKELEKIKKIIKEKPRGVTTKEIAKKIGTNRNAVGKYLDILQIIGDVDVEKYGRSKVYFISRSVPISTVFDYSNDFIVVVTKDMEAIEINTPFVKYLGLIKKDEIIGKHIKNLPINSSHSKITANIIETLEKQEILEDEIKVRRNNDSKSDRILARYVPTVLKDGEKGVAIILSKIEER